MEVLVVLEARDLGVAPGGRAVSLIDERGTDDVDNCFVGDFIGGCAKK